MSEGQESRFDDYEDLIIYHFDNDLRVNDGFFAVYNVNMSDGPEEDLKEQMSTMKPDEGSSLFKPIGDMDTYPTEIDGEDAYSFLYGIYLKDFDGATDGSIIIATTHNGQGYTFIFTAKPAKHFDDPEITEIREQMINSIKWND